MRREDLRELHYITHIDNVPSIWHRDILSHNRAQKIQHVSVADEKIQDLRKKVVVPRGKRLHDYVNLYFHARNPMMYEIRFRYKIRHEDLSVLRVSTDVLDLPNVVIADRNAAREDVRFYPVSSGLSRLDRELVFAERWTHIDPIEQHHRKGIKCAEVLVPDRIEPRFILGAYASCVESRNAAIEALGSIPISLEVVVNGHLFFR